MRKGYKTTSLFDRHFKERIAKNERLLQEYQDSVDAFLEYPTQVDDHSLEGKIVFLRSFALNDDYRVVFRETDNYYLFQDVGTHEQVYYR